MCFKKRSSDGNDLVLTFATACLTLLRVICELSSAPGVIKRAPCLSKELTTSTVQPFGGRGESLIVL